MTLLGPMLLVLLQASDCRFTIMVPPVPAAEHDDARPGTRGRIVEQPDAPLRIVDAEFTDAAIRIDVMNASDRTIAGGIITLEWLQGERRRTGSATLVRPLEPSRAMRLDARLPEPIAEGTSIVISVSSVRIGPCTYLPSRARPRPVISRGRGAPSVATWFEERRCDFAVRAAADPPEVLGSADLVARTHVGDQPGSPLRIRRVDLRKLKTNVGEGWIQVRGRYSIDVENVSDQPIDAGMVSVRMFGSSPDTLAAPFWRGSLAPRRSRRLTGDGSAIAEFDPGVTAADVRLLALVENVMFERCSYAPGRAFPTPAAPRADKHP